MRDGQIASTVTGVEMFKKLLNEGQAGENVGLLLRGIKRTDVERGQMVRSRERPFAFPAAVEDLAALKAHTKRFLLELK